MLCFSKSWNAKQRKFKKELIQTIRSKIGPIATPDFIHFTDGLPKTRSGKNNEKNTKKDSGE